MKKPLFKYSLITLFGLFNVNLLFAQQNLTLYNMEVVPQRMYANPAFFPAYSRINIGLPVLSSTYLNLSNSGFKYSDLVSHRASDDSLVVDPNKMIGKLKKNNYLSSSLQVDLLSFGFAVKNNYFSFNATEKINIRFRYTKDFMNFIIKGNGDPGSIGQTASFNFGLDAIHYREYALGYSRKVNDKLTVGTKLKYLYGMENISTEKSDVSLTTDPNNYNITAQSNIKINTSGLDSNSFNSIGNDPSGYLFKRGNKGAAIDLGGVYKLTEKITVSASLIDLGFIKWKDPSHMTIQSQNTDAHFTYRGMDLATLFNKDSTNNPGQQVVDSLKKVFKLDSVNKTYTTKLASQIYLGGNYALTEKVNAGVLFYGQFFDKKIHPGMALSFSQRLGKWFNYSISYSMYNRSYTNVGLGTAFNIGSVQWYIVGDNVLAIFPQKAKNINLRTGINLTFGRKTDKDKDGIFDKKDKCPELPGTKEFDGCPDTDHDHVSDKEDLCPHDSGSVELKGCPDRDGDKVTDLTDSCPDIAGVMKFNGCPDTDGDGIVDSKDECPDAAGTEDLNGCPDRDGDMIKDEDDACPDKPGPQINKGCPQVTLKMMNSMGGVMLEAVQRKDSTFLFDSIPADKTVRFKLEYAEDTTQKELTVVVFEKMSAIVYKDSLTGFYLFKGDSIADMVVKLDAQEEEVLKKAFDNLEFNSGMETIKPSSLNSLNELALLLNKKQNVRLKIVGHTDNQGDPKANLLLSQKRAQAVKTYLMSEGVSENRFKVEWFGDKQPVASNETEEGRQKNRRVEMMIIE